MFLLIVRDWIEKYKYFFSSPKNARENCLFLGGFFSISEEEI